MAQSHEEAEKIINNLSEKELKNKLIDILSDGYVLVEWPYSQEFMEEDWFEEEAIAALGSEDKTGSSAYFIPVHKII
jgi:hypothetical protein